MSLVPYDGSDISDSEEENDITETSNLKLASINTNNLLLDDQNEINEGNSTFLNLPKPKNNFADLPEELDDEFLHKKEKPTETAPKGKKSIKITIPTISHSKELDGDEVPIKKFRTANTKATGLFSILPPPRGGRATLIVPQSVKNASKPRTPLVPRSVKPVTVTPNTNEEDENDDDDDSGDFFSLDKVNEPVPIIPETKEPEQPVLRPVMYPERPPEGEEMPEPYENVDLNEEAIRSLCGSREKRMVDVSSAIVEVQENDIRPSNKEWLQKALLQGTGEDMEAAQAAAKAVPGGVLKRKHQITYLAEQAKANEHQLKAMWAQNRATRQQTQSKYGF